MAKTEAEFSEMIKGVELSKEAIIVLREDCGLPADKLPSWTSHPVLRRRLQMRAWAKLNTKHVSK